MDEEKDHRSESTTTENNDRRESATTIDHQIAGRRSQIMISPDMEEEESSQISTNITSMAWHDSLDLREREFERERCLFKQAAQSAREASATQLLNQRTKHEQEAKNAQFLWKRERNRERSLSELAAQSAREASAFFVLYQATKYEQETMNVAETSELAKVKVKDLSDIASGKQRELSELAADIAREASATELLTQKTQYEQEAKDNFETSELAKVKAKDLSDAASDKQRDLSEIAAQLAKWASANELLKQKTQYEQEAKDNFKTSELAKIEAKDLSDIASGKQRVLSELAAQSAREASANELLNQILKKMIVQCSWIFQRFTTQYEQEALDVAEKSVLSTIESKDLSDTASDKQRDLPELAAQSAREASANELMTQKTQYEQEAMDVAKTSNKFDYK
jgi:ribosomal protein S18